MNGKKTTDKKLPGKRKFSRTSCCKHNYEKDVNELVLILKPNTYPDYKSNKSACGQKKRAMLRFNQDPDQCQCIFTALNLDLAFI